MSTAHHHHNRQGSRSASRERPIPSRPTTPLRPPSRTSLRASQTTPSASGAKYTTGAADPRSTAANAGGSNSANTSGLEALNTLEPAFAELSDSMADLEANFMHLQLLNESLARFNENFGGFLYGMNMSAFCVDFPEAPIPSSFTRNPSNTASASSSFASSSANNPNIDSPYAKTPRHHHHHHHRDRDDPEATFLTTDTSFVENPPATATTSRTSKFGSTTPRAGSRAGAAAGGGRAGSTTRGRAGAGSGIARGGAARGGMTTRGVGRGGVGAAGSGIARGSAAGTRGRGTFR